MSTVQTRFPGAMGPEGFISCFDHLMDEKTLRRMIILKGGPGVGKSTFMRRLHAALTAGGEHSTLYFCSGDPDSLDAVAIPSHGLLILDGTAPHIVDPKIPGARDSLVNLGTCLNEAAMRSRLPHIRACMTDHAACSRRTRAFMQSICAIRRDSAASVAECIDEPRLARMTGALIAAVLPEKTGEAAHVRPVITDAITPKGEICLLSNNQAQRVIRVVHPFAMDPTPVLKSLSRAVQCAGYDVEEHLSPVSPGGLLHLSIPALSTLVTTSDKLTSEQIFDFSACLPAGSLLRRECALEQAHAAITRHTQLAVDALAQAKQLHDELETFYVPNMDFAAWQRIYDETLQSLKI